MDKLKIYSAYLPYGLIGKRIDSVTCELKGILEHEIIWDLKLDFDFKEHNNIWHDVKNLVKPILFSLEDLTKEITIGGETFVPFDELIKIKNVRLRVEKYENGDKKLLNINTFSFSLFDFEYKIIEKLLEWKFNVFNLPEIEYIKVTEENNPYK